MLKKLKINTALLLCAVFFFKMLFVSITVISSVNTRQSNSFITAHTSGNQKNRRFEALNRPVSCDYLVAEIYEEKEENKDKNETPKSGSFFLIHELYSLLTADAENKSRFSSFNHYFASDSSSRYLLYQVFRI